jgi:hypothetical protein
MYLLRHGIHAVETMSVEKHADVTTLVEICAAVMTIVVTLADVILGAEKIVVEIHAVGMIVEAGTLGVVMTLVATHVAKKMTLVTHLDSILAPDVLPTKALTTTLKIPSNWQLLLRPALKDLKKP